MQTYRPYRTAILTGRQLRQLSRITPHRAVLDTVRTWAVILAAWTAVALFPHWWVVLAAIPVIGTRFYALHILAHDGLHRRLFPERRHNDLWTDVFIIGAVGAVTRLNRVNHIQHHREMALPEDPDRYKYISANKSTRARFLLSLTGLPYLLVAARNVLLRRGSQSARDAGATAAPSASYTLRDLAILVGWQVALLGGLTAAIGWWAYPVLWLAPFYVFTYLADLLRVFAEHSQPSFDDAASDAHRLTSFTSNWLERQFFAPFNMNLHAAHHLWPAIPYYNLPEADRLVRQSPFAAELEWRTSYVSYLLRYWQALFGKNSRLEASPG